MKIIIFFIILIFALSANTIYAGNKAKVLNGKWKCDNKNYDINFNIDDYPHGIMRFSENGRKKIISLLVTDADSKMMVIFTPSNSEPKIYDFIFDNDNEFEVVNNENEVIDNCRRIH